MRVLHNAMVKPVELGSGIGLKFTIWHYDLVQMWVWERFVELRPKPNVIERGDPRSERWNGVAKFEVSRFVKLLEAFRHLKLMSSHRLQSSGSCSSEYSSWLLRWCKISKVQWWSQTIWLVCS
ncbi:uncharacterized protein LOC108209370 isoform X2 [Daucus carota subsp. sativus]|uniref:uncharacterized protein LOC108209370 isoform X2 n=1 Tax=Daucus carota subsp. sativus TaxID=79200 RepID=UPI0007EFD74B|nr:PREDICTED: uncharacterized protein LOC108208021 [Daucus carota subsp. sativus]XP_017233979.1 PREDICTED: uncharacterized protein LOC108208021 [Daucus carota subsp. sativus]